MDKIKVLVSGCNGTMGKIVCNCIYKSDDMEVVCGYDTSASVQSDFDVFDNVQDLYKSNYSIDVIIDFSKPEGTLSLLDFAEYYGIPMVIATTGFTKEQQSIIDKHSENNIIFEASNMCQGAFIHEKLAAELAPKFPGYSIEIVERHHSNKVDAPSGTALTLANAMNRALDNSMELICGRTGKHKRETNEIGISSVRGGGIVGEHTIYFTGEFDEFEVTHRVFQKTVFAEGALRAARDLVERANDGYVNGFYTLEDLQ